MRPVLPNAVRCTALARWTGNGRSRCRKRAWGSAQLCTMHERFPPRPKADTSLLAELGSFELGGDKVIRVQLRQGKDGPFVAIRLFLGETPTRKALYLAPSDLDGFALALSDAAEALEEGGW